jgi:ribosomal protein S24E
MLIVITKIKNGYIMTVSPTYATIITRNDSIRNAEEKYFISSYEEAFSKLQELGIK